MLERASTRVSAQDGSTRLPKLESFRSFLLTDCNTHLMESSDRPRFASTNQVPAECLKMGSRLIAQNADQVTRDRLVKAGRMPCWPDANMDRDAAVCSPCRVASVPQR